MPKASEMILQPNVSSVVLVEPYGPEFGEIIAKLSEQQSSQVIECGSAMEALSIARRLDFCVVLVNASTPADVNQHVTLLKTLSAQIQTRKTVRVLATVSPMLAPEVLEKLTVYGCTEQIPENTSTKAILFKVDRHLKALSGAGSPKDEDVLLISSNAPSTDKTEPELGSLLEPSAGVRLGPVLELPQDCWSISGGGARKQLGKWRIKLRGPTADRGRWVAAKAARGDMWKWHPTDDPESGAGSHSGWYCEAEGRPECQRGIWTFVGSAVWLGYLENDQEVGAKLVLSDQGVVVVAADSEAARAALGLTRFEPEESEQDASVEAAEERGGVEVPRALEEADLVAKSDEPDHVSEVDDHVEAPSAPAGLDKLFDAHGQGPTLSALAMYFLASELIARRDASLRASCDRFCEYLYASFGGMRVELWTRASRGGEEGWCCVGSSDRGPGRYGELVRARGVKGDWAGKHEGSPVRLAEVRPVLRDAIGVLAIGGRGAVKVDPEYASAAARAAVGLVAGSREGLAS